MRKKAWIGDRTNQERKILKESICDPSPEEGLLWERDGSKTITIREKNSTCGREWEGVKQVAM